MINERGFNLKTQNKSNSLPMKIRTFIGDYISLP